MDFAIKVFVFRLFGYLSTNEGIQTLLRAVSVIQQFVLNYLEKTKLNGRRGVSVFRYCLNRLSEIVLNFNDIKRMSNQALRLLSIWINAALNFI